MMDAQCECSQTVLVGLLRSAGSVVPFVCPQYVIYDFETMLDIKLLNETNRSY